MPRQSSICALCIGLGTLLGSPVAMADEHTAVEVSGAPRPGEESGRIDEIDEGDSAFRELGRGLLVLPRTAFEIAFGPLRAGVWAYERFKLRDRWFQIFFNDARTVGIYPTLRFDADFGVNAGGRFVARDMFGEREHLAIRAGFGGRWNEIVTGAIRSGDRFGRVDLELAAEHERRPHEHYYGVGNGDPMELRYRQQLRRASMIVDVRPVGDLHVRTAGAIAELQFDPADDPIMPGTLVGFEGLRYAYGDVELVWDSRGRYTRWEPGSLASIGWLASTYAGRFAVEDGADFWRFGGDAQHFLRITTGPRVIATRVHLEAVSGRIEEVPFDELPRLGGNTLLRGYPTDRFRDRVAALGTLEYRWDLAWFLVATTFVDAGRVAPSFGELSTEGLRVGYGIGLEGYTERSFVIRASLASSIDGGVFFNVAFDPAFELDPRVERR